MTASTAFGWREGMAYGLLGLPLAFVALPLYVVLPNHYATQFGVPLAALGALLLGARLFDALVDPLIGRVADRLFGKSLRQVLAAGGIAALALAAGFALLFFPPVRTPGALLVWAAFCLLVTYVAYSVLSVSHQAWGARLGGDETRQSRIVGWREAMGLVGVVFAAVAPTLLGLAATSAILAVALACAWLAWTQSPRPMVTSAAHTISIWLPFRRPAFVRLLAVFVVNGIASAVPATLVLFFVQDRLQAPVAWQPAFLGSYFLSAAVSIALWLKLVNRFGLARTWLAGMLLSIAVFAFASQLGSGDSMQFLIVCVLSGVSLGTDLALPGALLAGVIAQAGDRGQAEGAYFGWWNFATKLNLALAAGLALPLLAFFGYVPGTRDASALAALSGAYCVLPCLLKLVAAAMLYALVVRVPKTRREKQ